MNILFYDSIAPYSYDGEALLSRAMGGTEASVIRVAEGLSEVHSVSVMQKARKVFCEYGGVAYYPKGMALTRSPDVIICLREANSLKNFRSQYPLAKLMLWSHDVIQDWVEEELLRKLRADWVVVSEWHKHQLIDALRAHGRDPSGIKIHVIYNGIDDALVPDSMAVNNKVLLYTSSPHKGLAYTLNVFAMIRRMDPLFELHIANPGYYPDWADALPPGAKLLGPVPHPELMQHVRSALALLHLNTVFPETQGIVYGEANAVGTPFITHPLGAVRESSGHPSQIMDVRLHEKVVDRVLQWSSGERPTVRLRPDMRMSAVLSKWKKVLS